MKKQKNDYKTEQLETQAETETYSYLTKQNANVNFRLPRTTVR